MIKTIHAAIASCESAIEIARREAHRVGSRKQALTLLGQVLKVVGRVGNRLKEVSLAMSAAHQNIGEDIVEAGRWLDREHPFDGEGANYSWEHLAVRGVVARLEFELPAFKEQLATLTDAQRDLLAESLTNIVTLAQLRTYNSLNPITIDDQSDEQWDRSGMEGTTGAMAASEGLAAEAHAELAGIDDELDTHVQTLSAKQES